MAKRAELSRSNGSPADDQVVALLVTRPGVDLCDRCLAAALGLGRDEVGRITTTLAQLPAFLRDTWRCGQCGRAGKVIRLLSSSRAIAALAAGFRALDLEAS